MPERVLIAGTGAMACLVAGRLAAAGNEVTMLGTWPEGLRALQRGVEVAGEGRYEVRATDDPLTCRGHALALVLVKAWQTRATAARLRICRPRRLLTLQNGLGHREVLEAEAGVATFGAALQAPGRVLPGGTGEAWLEAGPFADLLERAGFEVRRSADVDRLLWAKLVVNASLNPVAALAGVRNGEVLARPDLRRRMRAAAREAGTVAEALGFGLRDPVAAAEEVAARTASNRCSMLSDLERGAPTEVEAINGEVVRAGERLGAPTPVNRALREEILCVRR